VSHANSKPLGVLAWSIVLTAILAAILGAGIVWLVQRLHAEEEWVRRSRVVQNQIAEILILAQRMESAQRGYLLTGRGVYLENYNGAEKALPCCSTKQPGCLLITHDSRRRSPACNGS
jgi:CHASE3 domain sensor protein